MSNINVSGIIFNANSYAIAKKYAFNYGNPIAIFDSSSLSTGTQNTAYKNGVSGDRYQFSEFALLLFCQFTTGAGWKVVAVPTISFKSSSITDNGAVVSQNYTSDNRRVHLRYTNETSFYVGLAQNTNRFIIYGIK